MRKPYLAALLSLLSILGCAREHLDDVIAPQNPQYVTRGKELVNGFAACGRCHGHVSLPQSPLSGGRAITDLYGEIVVPNITSSASGVGAKTDEQILGSLRGYWGEDAKFRSPEVHKGYEWLSDKDALSIVAYLRTVSPIKNEVAKRSVSFMDRNTTGFFEGQFAVHGFVPEPQKKDSLQYGKYIIDHVARCGTCHSTQATVLSGAVYLGGNENVPSLVGGKETMSYWNEAQIVIYLRSGQRPDGTFIDPSKCPIEFYKNGTEEEMNAIALYVRSLS